jgi:hypothetical protein
VRVASGSALSGKDGTGSALVTPPGQWAVSHVPGATAQATIAKAAVAGTRHVCTAIIVTLTATGSAPAAAVLGWTLRDGATGAGTILLAGRIAIEAVAGYNVPPVLLSGLNIVGSVNTAMTLEFDSGAGNNTTEAVAMAGYDVI